MTRLQEIEQELRQLGCVSSDCVVFAVEQNKVPCICFAEGQTYDTDWKQALRLRAEQVAILTDAMHSWKRDP